MSVEAIAWAWQQPVRGTQKLVLLALADGAGHDDSCYPAIGTIAAMAGVGTTAARDAIRALEAGGFVTCCERTRSNGARSSNLYTLTRPTDSVGAAPRMPLGSPSGQPDGNVNHQKEPISSSDEEETRQRALLPSAVDEVWATYVEVMAPRRRELDPQGRRLILDALKAASVAECQRAIRGCHASAFHMGANDRGKKYNALSQILKGKRGGRTTREQIDFFLELAERSGVSARVQSVDQGRLRQAKDTIIEAHTFPNDALLAERAQEAKRWLEERGWRVGARESDGWPTFEVAA